MAMAAYRNENQRRGGGGENANMAWRNIGGDSKIANSMVRVRRSFE
jgi:hypothetical protein